MKQLFMRFFAVFSDAAQKYRAPIECVFSDAHFIGALRPRMRDTNSITLRIAEYRGPAMKNNVK